MSLQCLRFLLRRFSEVQLWLLFRARLLLLFLFLLDLLGKFDLLVQLPLFLFVRSFEPFLFGAVLRFAEYVVDLPRGEFDLTHWFEELSSRTQHHCRKGQKALGIALPPQSQHVCSQAAGILFEVFVSDHLDCLLERAAVVCSRTPRRIGLLVDVQGCWEDTVLFKIFLDFRDDVTRHKADLLLNLFKGRDGLECFDRAS